MSDATIPDKLGPAARWAVAGIALFVFFLIAAEKFNEGAYGPGTANAILFVVTFVVAVKWDQISKAALRWRKQVAFTLIALGAIILAVGAYLLAPTVASKPAAPEVAQAAQPITYLKETNIFAGSASPPQNPRFTGKFTRSGQRARLYVDDRYYPGGIMGPSGWIRTPRVLLGEYRDFVNDMSVDVAILTPFENDGRKLWRWGLPTDNVDPKTTFQSHAWHRGRVAVLIDDAPPEYFYFIIDISSPNEPPHVIGKERFDFAREWEAEEAQQK